MNLEQRIRRDNRLLAGDEEASALHACLAEHLFEADLDAAFLARKCGASRQMRDRLAAKFGPLKAYVTELRMIEGLRLVQGTRLSFKRIARQLGYRVVKTFRRAFEKQHGVTPKAMRQRSTAERAGEAAAAGGGAVEGPEVGGGDAEGCRPAERLTRWAMAALLRRSAALGLLDPERKRELRDRLRHRHPALAEPALGEAEAPAATATTATAEPTAPVVLTPAGVRLETIAAAAVFGRILGLPDEDLRHAMLEGVLLGTPTAFDVLQQFCYAQVKWDPERALRAAELGVQLIESHCELMGGEAGGWKVVAWAFLARVRMLAGDFGAADQVLGFAWQEVAESGRAPAPWAEIEVRRVEGMIRMHQGRGLEAAVALDRAVELGRCLDVSDPDRVHSLFERLELASLDGDAETALPLCDELDELALVGAPDRTQLALWRGSASYHRGKAAAAAGRHEEAQASLLRAAEVIAADPEAAAGVYELAVLGSFILHELGRLEGCADRLDEYDVYLRRVLDRYRRLRLPVLGAAAKAELAALAALRGEAAEARRLAASAADQLERLPGHRQAWSAARRLRALTEGGAEAAEDEIAGSARRAATCDLLAWLCVELDALRWQISGAQAVPRSEAGRIGA